MPDLGNYVGKWIAIVGEEIVASGDQGKKVFLKAKNKYPKKDPFIMKVPTDVVMCLWFENVYSLSYQRSQSYSL